MDRKATGLEALVCFDDPLAGVEDVLGSSILDVIGSHAATAPQKTIREWCDAFALPLPRWYDGGGGNKPSRVWPREWIVCYKMEINNLCIEIVNQWKLVNELHRFRPTWRTEDEYWTKMEPLKQVDRNDIIRYFTSHIFTGEISENRMKLLDEVSMDQLEAEMIAIVMGDFGRMTTITTEPHIAERTQELTNVAKIGHLFNMYRTRKAEIDEHNKRIRFASERIKADMQPFRVAWLHYARLCEKYRHFGETVRILVEGKTFENTPFTKQYIQELLENVTPLELVEMNKDNYPERTKYNSQELDDAIAVANAIIKCRNKSASQGDYDILYSPMYGVSSEVFARVLWEPSTPAGEPFCWVMNEIHVHTL
jgi:hypothetical protein